MKILNRIVAIAFAVATIFFAWLWHHSLSLPYNSEGRYFDEERNVVYLQQSVVAYGTTLIGCLLLSLFFANFGFRRTKEL